MFKALLAWENVFEYFALIFKYIILGGLNNSNIQIIVQFFLLRAYIEFSVRYLKIKQI